MSKLKGYSIHLKKKTFLCWSFFLLLNNIVNSIRQILKTPSVALVSCVYHIQFKRSTLCCQFVGVEVSLCDMILSFTTTDLTLICQEVSTRDVMKKYYTFFLFPFFVCFFYSYNNLSKLLVKRNRSCSSHFLFILLKKEEKTEFLDKFT